VDNFFCGLDATVDNPVNKLWITLTCGVDATVDKLWITFRIFHYPHVIHRPKVIHSLYTFYPHVNQTPTLAVHPHYVRTCHYY